MQNYPKPGPQGGTLIRQVVQFFRHHATSGAREDLPLKQPLLIACSGGSDSVALAVLMARYGRRIIAPRMLTLVHVNHGWRGEESDEDARSVRRLAQDLGLRVIVYRAKTKPAPGDSWEDHARKLRKRCFRQAIRKTGAVAILTAHTADDRFETQLWRLLTNPEKGLTGGIHRVFKGEWRPFLDVTKDNAHTFLKEEQFSWREDSSNRDLRFLRNRIRAELVPVVEKLFPGVKRRFSLSNSRR